MTENKRKLIFFWAYREWGGAQIYFLAIIKEALADWDVRVVLPKNSSKELIGFLAKTGVSIEYIDFYIDLGEAPTIVRKIRRQWSRISSEIKTLKYLRKFELAESILHIETSPWQSWILLALLLRRKANVFVTLHNAPTAPSKLRRMIWRARMRFVSRLRGFHIFTSNRDTRERIRDLVVPGSWERIPVTYTCVDPPQIDEVLRNGENRPAIRARHNIRENEFVVLCVGQFIDRKGRWIFLDAAKHLKAAHPDVLFVWVLPDAPTASDNIRIAEYELGDRLRLILSAEIGTTREEILSFFRVADIFVLPSFVEGLPIALLEAMALGIPSISTNVYAIPEAIKDGETGILVEAGDAASLAGAVIRLKNNAELRDTLAQKGRKFVLEHFDERQAARIAISNYKECFENGR
jgi:glycosyltransferase involved in cell wall biosynthesis